jgi:hypothetical protein
MPRMIVTRTRPVRYPSGPEGKEYQQGQEFEVLSERDAKAFSLIRAAQLVDDKKKAKADAKVETKVLKAEDKAAEPSKVAPMTTAQAEPLVGTQSGKYKTRDMRSED